MDRSFASNSVIVAAILLVLLAVLGYFWLRPPEMSLVARKRFRLAVILATISAVLLAVDVTIFASIPPAEFNSWRAAIFWIAFVDFWINGAALLRFFHVAVNLLPFTKGDPSDITIVGIGFGFVVLFLQGVSAYFEVMCLFVP
jgi:hypothetical protein